MKCARPYKTLILADRLTGLNELFKDSHCARIGQMKKATTCFLTRVPRRSNFAPSTKTEQENGSQGNLKESARKEQSDAGTDGGTYQCHPAGRQPLGNGHDAAQPRAAQSAFP